MPETYDLIVIGAGTAARVAAMRVRKAGKSVAVIDCRPYGGTCALRGCDPKKMLRHGAAVIDDARRMRGNGVVGDDRIDWRELMAFKRTFTDPVPGKQEQSYHDAGVKTYHGPAYFTGANTLVVEGKTLVGRHILIASGAASVPLGLPGEGHAIDNEAFLTLEDLPRRIILVGGGYIAAEFSTIAANAGAEVTILQRGPRMLTGFDPDLVGWLMPRLRDAGINVQLDTAVEAIDKTGDGFSVRASTGGESKSFAADLVVHAGGRRPALEALDLDAAGIAHEHGRLKLNEHLQSVSNPAVYAAGDAAQMGPPLTPVSSHDGKVVAGNVLEGNHLRPDYRGVPSVAFTLPPIASVGLGEAEARERGVRFRVNSSFVPGWYTARQAAEPVYGFKVLVDEGDDSIVGAHLVGPHAEGVINLFALAIRHGLTAGDLKSTMFAYPTGASDVGSML
jgi:glutathione reductase (NADPH)